MAEDRILPYGSPLPASWLAALQEFIGTAAVNVTLSLASATTVQVVAGANSGQVGLGIDGLFRYINSTVTAAVTGGAGTYDVFATCGPNVFVATGGSPPETDSTNYAFALQVLSQGSTPTPSPSVTNWRRVGWLTWNGSAITALVPLVGQLDATATMAPGDLVVSAAAARPGCLLCNGLPYSAGVYPGLFAAVGYTYGGSAGTFQVPDYRGRVIMGAGNGIGGGGSGSGTPSGGLSLTGRSRGDWGGEEKHSLLANESGTPIHSHRFPNLGGTEQLAATLPGTDSGPTNPSWPSSPQPAHLLTTDGPHNGIGVTVTSSGDSDTVTLAWDWSTGYFPPNWVNGTASQTQDASQGHNNVQPFTAANVFIKT